MAELSTLCSSTGLGWGLGLVCFATWSIRYCINRYAAAAVAGWLAVGLAFWQRPGFTIPTVRLRELEVNEYSVPLHYCRGCDGSVDFVYLQGAEVAFTRFVQ